MTMKTPEILLACALVALVSGAVAAWAVRTLEADPPRGVEAARAAESAPAPNAPELGDLRRLLDDLRLESSALGARIAALEARSEVGSPLQDGAGRVPVEASRPPGAGARESDGLELDLSPAFVASVGRALEAIQAREDEERERAREEMQARRIEERVARLQEELGLTNRQASDLRTTLLAMDDKREELFTSLREGSTDPREVRDSFRGLRDEMDQRLQAFLTPEQFEAFARQEQDRRAFDFGAPPFGGGREGLDAARRADGRRAGG
jgi:hypothetical protein